jgi:hypothetical protein
MEFPVRTVPDLPIVDIRVATVEQTPVVRVVQELGEGVRLTLVQARRTIAIGDDAPAEGIASVALAEGVFVVGLAPVPTDSVVTLLSRIR